MYQNFNPSTSPTSLQRQSFTTQFEPYRLSLFNLTQESLLETLTYLSPDACTFVERALLPSLSTGELPNRKRIEESLSHSSIRDARLERSYRFISGYCAMQRDEFTLNSEWPITIERELRNRERFTLSIDLPTPGEDNSRHQTASSSSERSAVHHLASTNNGGSGWCFADELASKLEFSPLSHFCRNGWAQLITHPKEHRVSINLTQSMQLQLYPCELANTLQDYIVHFPHHIPKEVIFLSREPWRENQFARTVDDTIGTALVTSGLLLQGRESMRDSFYLNDDTLQDCARILHHAAIPECTFDYCANYVSGKDHNREFETGTPDDAHLYSHFDSSSSPSSLHKLHNPKRNNAGSTTTTIQCGRANLRWSNPPEPEVLECLSPPYTQTPPRTILSASTVDIATFNYENKNEETARLNQLAWSETVRIAQKYGIARNRDELELSVLQHRSNAGYPSIISPVFYMHLGDDILLHLTTSM